MFNKYHFIEDFKNHLETESINCNDFSDLIHEYIDNECIYYSDCFDICKELNYTHFYSDDFGKAENICQLAYFALYDLVNEHYSELEQIYSEYSNIEE
jgi:hypothetical protein